MKGMSILERHLFLLSIDIAENKMMTWPERSCAMIG